MKRREFLSLVGGAFIAPLAASAQHGAMPTIGFLSSRSLADSAHLVSAFREGLSRTGYLERQNVAMEFRWAEGNHGRLPLLADDLVRRRVAVIVAVGGEASAFAAKAAAPKIPIIFAIGGDPVQLGLVATYSRPGGNITGFSLLTAETNAKRLGVLRELVPTARVIAVLFNPTLQQAAAQRKELEDAARAIDRQIYILDAIDDAELTTAFRELTERRAEALLIGGSPFFDTRRDRIVALAAEHRIPTIHQFREHATAGGLISYGPSITEGYHQVGEYTGRILKGEKAGELPVVQSAKFELVINLKTARALGLGIPPTLLARADEVIE